MGIMRIKDVKSYWSERFACLSTPYFRNIMSRNVFQLVSKFLNCHDNESEDARWNSERYDPLHKFCLLLNGLNDTCTRYFIPDRLISIDESLIGMNNRTESMQYIPIGEWSYTHWRLGNWISTSHYGILREEMFTAIFWIWALLWHGEGTDDWSRVTQQRLSSLCWHFSYQPHPCTVSPLQEDSPYWDTLFKQKGSSSNV